MIKPFGRPSIVNLVDQQINDELFSIRETDPQTLIHPMFSFLTVAMIMISVPVFVKIFLSRPAKELTLGSLIIESDETAHQNS